MKTKRLTGIVILIGLIFGITACERELPTPEETTATTEEVSSATEVIAEIYLFATQTALAAGGTIIAPPGEVTPETPITTPAVPVFTAQPTSPPLPTPTATLLTAPTATPGLPTTYTLQKGEFPYCIARRFNIDPGELLRINGMTSGSYFYAGMTLKIPQSGRSFPGNRALRPHPTTYTVQPGDTIYEIACLFGDVDPEAIAFVNGLKPPYRLTAGMVLNIP